MHLHGNIFLLRLQSFAYAFFFQSAGMTQRIIFFKIISHQTKNLTILWSDYKIQQLIHAGFDSSCKDHVFACELCKVWWGGPTGWPSHANSPATPPHYTHITHTHCYIHTPTHAKNTLANFAPNTHTVLQTAL